MNQLNKHVLECVLPRFDSCSHHIEQNLSLYENDRLYCEPKPFEIKQNGQSNNVIKSYKDQDRPDEYKLKYILLEKILNLLSVHKINYNYNKKTKFEMRLCNLIDCLLDKYKNHSLQDYSDICTEYIDENDTHKIDEYYETTLLHLCVLLSLRDLLDKLVELKDLVLNKIQLRQLSEIKSELNIFSLDNNGQTPLVNTFLIFFWLFKV
jgi:hypothetical protein